MEDVIAKLLKLIAGRNTAQKVVLRASIVLAHINGSNKVEIARALNTSRPTVDLWLNRFEEQGVGGLLKDKTRPGRKKQINAKKEEQIVQDTLNKTPKGQTHWSERTMAEYAGVSKMSVHRIWNKYNIKPHLVETFKISNDPHFVEKVHDIVGLYMNPPEKALVLSVDEKSQIQALDRTQPGLPMKPGRKGTMTHDYKRHGTTTLFAALNMMTGDVIGKCYQKHRSKEFLSFLKKIDNETPQELDIHIVLDNYATHKTALIRKWLDKHPRFHFHFTPTSASWLNMIERFFSELTTKAVRRGVFHSVEELKKAIMAFLKQHNDDPKIYVWTKDAGTILAKVAKCKEALVAEH
jgi:transposase